MKKYSTAFILSLTMCLCVLTIASIAQSNQNKDINEIVQSKKFAFKVIHESGGDFAVGNYYFDLINDSLSVQLPYHGNSGTAAYTIDDNGIIAHTRNFSYQCTATKNSGYIIKINLTNDRITRDFILHVNKKGYVVLTVDSINRDSISFNGVLEAIE